MKVLHLNDKLEISGGVEVNISNIIKYLKESQVQSFWLGICQENGLYCVREKGKCQLDFKSINEVFDYLKRFVNINEIDIIHIHSISNPRLIRKCFKIVPVIRSMRDPRMFCPGQGKFWRNSEKICDIPFGKHCVYHAYSQGCMNRHPKRVINSIYNTFKEIDFSKEMYKAIIVMSDYMYSESIKVGMPSKVLKVNPHLTNLIPTNKLIDTSNREVKHIIFIGRLSRTKGVHYFIKVGIALLEKGKKLIFDIVGDGHDRKIFQDMIPVALQKYFIFHGWQSKENVQHLLSNSFLMLFTSIYPEAFGISGIEAMMQGKPVVGFNVGGVSTWLKNEKTGYLIEVKNIEEMVIKTLEIIENTKLYEKFSNGARQVALKEFCPDQHIDKLISIYKSAVK